MSSYIAEAFVAVRADTGGIARDIREGVAAATKDYKPEIKLKVTPYVLKKDIDEFVVSRIKATQATINVTPLLVTKSINTQLEAIKDQVVHVTAVVTKTTQAGASTITSDQIVTPVLNEQALAAIVGRIEATKPVITVDAILDPAAEARIEGLKTQLVNVAPVARAAGSTAGPAAAAGAAEADAQSAAIRRIARADAELEASTAAVAKGITDQSSAEAANEVVSRSLTRVKASLAAATKAEDVATEQQLTLRQSQLEQLQQEIKARSLLSSINVTQGVLGNPPVGEVSSEEAAKNLNLAKTNAANLALAIEAAGASGNKNLAGIATSTQKLVDVQLEEQLALSASAAAAEEHAAALSADQKAAESTAKTIAGLTAQVERATSADFNLTQQKSRLISVDQKLIASINELQKATYSGAQADVRSLQTLEAKVAAQKSAVTAQIQASAAAKRAQAEDEARVASGRTGLLQARRGAAATGATFLGLRGAVLSASTGFLAATVAVTGLGKIVKTAEELQQSLHTFNAVSEATAAQMVLVDNQARLLGADLSLPATSAKDAAEAMTELAKAGLSVEQSMAAAKGVLQLSAAANIDVGTSANIVATELNAFGLAGEEATKVVDNLAGASIAAQGDISDFALAFQQTSAVAHQVGLSFETTTAILTQFAKAGLHGSDAGTSLRTLLLRLVPTTKAAADAQEELGIHLNRSIPIGAQFLNLVDQYTVALAKLGPIAQQEALTKIFGQDAIRGASISLTKGAAALETVQEQTSKAGSAAELTKARTEGLGGSVEGLKSEISTLSATIGTAFLPILSDTAKEFATIASSANSATTEILKLSQTPIGPIPSLTGSIGFLGGTDTIVKILIPAITALTVKSLISGKLRQRAEEQVEKTVLSVNAALERGAVTQDQVNALWETMGIKAEDALTIQLEATARAEAANKGLIVSNEKLLAVKEQIAAVDRGAAFGSVRGIARPAAGAAAAAGKTVLDENGVPIVAATSAAATEGVWVKANEGIAASSVKTAAVQVTAEESKAAAARLAAAAAETAWLEEAGVVERSQVLLAAKMTALQGRLGRFKGLAGGLGVGIGATVAGGLIGGTAGGILSGAGQGAVLGSLIPIPGATLVGAAGGAALGLVSAQSAKRKADRAKWDSKSYQDQLTFLLSLDKQDPEHPAIGRGGQLFLSLTGYKLKSNPFDATTAGILSQTHGFSAPISLPGLKLPSGPVGTIDVASLIPKTTFVGPSGGPGRGSRTPDLQALPNSFFKTKIIGGGPLGDFLKVSKDNAKIQIAQFKENTVLQAQIAIAEAELQGNTVKKDAALNVLIKQDQKTADSIKRRLAANLPGLLGYVIKDEKERKRLGELLVKTLQDEKSLQGQLSQAAQFSISTGAQIAQIVASSTKGLQDDLASAQRIFDETNAALKKAIKNHAANVDDLRIQAAQARASVVGAQGAISDKAASDAEKAANDAKDRARQAIQNQNDLLKRAADAAGNIGAAEDRYIAFLRRQKDKAKQTTEERIAAENDYDAELKRRQDAIRAIADARLSFRRAGIDNVLLKAQATETTEDDKKAFRAYIKVDQDEIKTWQKVVTSTKSTILEKINAMTQIRILRGDITKQQQAIKGVTGGGGFTLNDLFKEAANQFATFGSNITSRTGVLSGQDARASLGASIVNDFATRLQQQSLTEQERQTRILESIDGKLSFSKKGEAYLDNVGNIPNAPPQWRKARAAQINAWGG